MRTMKARPASQVALAMGLLLAGLGSAEAKQRLAWEIDIPSQFVQISVDDRFERLVVYIETWTVPGKPRSPQRLQAFDRSGNLVWENHTDTCIIPAERAPIIWANHGKEGVILDRVTGKVLRRSRKLMGLMRGDALMQLGEKCSQVSLSPDGRYLFTARIECLGEFDCPIRESMITDTLTGKPEWRAEGDLAVPGHMMPDDASFFISGKGMFSRTGKRLWSFPCVKESERKGLHQTVCPPEKYKAKPWTDKKGGPGFDAVSRDGRYLLGFEGAVLDSIDTYYLYLSSGDPGQPWKKLPLPPPPLDADTVMFSEDGRHIALFKYHRRLPEMRIQMMSTEGTMLWTRVSSAAVLAPRSPDGGPYCGGFSGNLLLATPGEFVDVYDLDGNVVKRVLSPPVTEGINCSGELNTCMSKMRLLEDRKYAIIRRWSSRRMDKTRIQVWEGSLDEPD